MVEEKKPIGLGKFILILAFLLIILESGVIVYLNKKISILEKEYKWVAGLLKSVPKEPIIVPVDCTSSSTSEKLETIEVPPSEQTQR
jgi:hypothetical protein